MFHSEWNGDWVEVSVPYLELEQGYEREGIGLGQSSVVPLNGGEEVKEELRGVLLPVGAKLHVTSANECLEHGRPDSFLWLTRRRDIGRDKIDFIAPS